MLDHIQHLLAAPELVARTWAAAKREGGGEITEREITVLLADFATVCGQGPGTIGWGEGPYGEGVYGGGPQLVVTLDDGSKRPLTAIMANVIKMWEQLLARWGCDSEGAPATAGPTKSTSHVGKRCATVALRRHNRSPAMPAVQAGLG